MPEFDLRKVTLPRSAVDTLSDDEQYALFVLGHMFNEVNVLARMVLMGQTRRADATDAEKAGAIFQATMFARLLAGKIYEAQLKVNDRVVNAFLVEQCYPHMDVDEGKAMLRAFNKAAAGCKWLNEVRNGHAMHYPEKRRWERAMAFARDKRLDFDMFCGPRTAEVLYRGADIVASVGFFSEVDEGEWGSGLSSLLTELPALSRLLSDFINAVLTAFFLRFKDNGVPFKMRTKIRNVPRFDRPDFTTFEIPYFPEYRDS